MKIVPKTQLILDRKEPSNPAGKPVDVNTTIGNDLISRGLADPFVEHEPVKLAAK